MSELDLIKNRMWREEHPVCPHCGHEIDMTDGERLMGHVTTWGEDEPQEEVCSGCGATIYLQERVSRRWLAGRTPEEANDLY